MAKSQGTEAADALGTIRAERLQLLDSASRATEPLLAARRQKNSRHRSYHNPSRHLPTESPLPQAPNLRPTSRRSDQSKRLLESAARFKKPYLFQDESRFGQQETTTNVWAEQGSRPTAIRQTEYQYLWVLGAVCPETGHAEGSPWETAGPHIGWIKQFIAAHWPPPVVSIHPSRSFAARRVRH